MIFFIKILFAFIVLFSPCAYGAEPDAETLRKAFEASRQAEGSKLDDYRLTDQDGVSFSLSDYFKDGKPLVISYVYTSCPHVCPTITAEFKNVVKKAGEKLGKRFSVLTIGFDTVNDKPSRLKEYGGKFTDDFADFRFASADEQTIKRLTGQAGFFYLKREDGSFDHIDMATVVGADGVIYKQAYSIRTQPDNLLARIEEAVTGKPATGAKASLVDKIKFFCYKYDPYTGRYVIDYPIILSVLMQALVIGGIVYAVWGKRMRERFRSKRAPK